MIDSLIKMVNEIADNMSLNQGSEMAAERVAEHLRKFWARSMKQDIIDYVRSGGNQLTPLARQGVLQLADDMQAGAGNR